MVGISIFGNGLIFGAEIGAIKNVAGRLAKLSGKSTKIAKVTAKTAKGCKSGW